MRKIKNLLFIFFSVIVFILFLIFLIFLHTKKQDNLSLEVAIQKTVEVMNSPELKEKNGIPLKANLKKSAPMDSNYYVEYWNYYFELENSPSFVVVTVYPNRTLWILPWFNSKKDLSVEVELVK